MHCIVLAVVLLAGCEGKGRSAAPPAAKAVPIAPRASPTPAPALPAPARPIPYKLGRDAFVWSFAEASNTAAAWETAAASFEDDLAACETKCGETAYAIVLARKNALTAEASEPPPGDDPIAELPPRVQATIEAIDQYVALGDAADPDVNGARFVGASLTYRWRQVDVAIERLTEILTSHRGHFTAEYAANQLLDLLMRTNRTDELRRWVLMLLADAAFLADKPELRATLEQLRATFQAAAVP